jgi:hypothetical protein
MNPVEQRMVALTDEELLDLVENHAGDYEPFALETARTELERRKLEPDTVQRLREQAAASSAAEQPSTFAEGIAVYYGFAFRLFFGMVAWPLVFFAARLARKEDREEEARKLRIAAWFGVAAWVVLALSLFAKLYLKLE